MTTQQVQDPWQTAMDPSKQVSEWFGQMKVNPWFCALVKGVGKVAWDEKSVDPNTGNPLRKYTAIDLILTPISSQAMEDITRTVIAEFGEWPDIVLPSLKAIGILNLQNLNGAWVRCEMTGTGRTYINSNGETKEATTFKFLQVYTDEATCRAAYKAAHGGNGGNQQVTSAQASPPTQTTPPVNGNQRRETAVKFLRTYVQNACRAANGDLENARNGLAKMIANQPLLAEFFTVDSPEVVDLMTELLSPIPF